MLIYQKEVLIYQKWVLIYQKLTTIFLICWPFQFGISANPAGRRKRTPAVLAMADGVSIVIEHTKRSDTQRALWTAVLVAAVTSRKARETGLRAPMTPSML